MIETGKLYRLNRGNQNQSVGLVIKGLTASVQVFGSTIKPTQLSDMTDCTDAEILTEGTWSFTMLPEYVSVSGTADRIDIVNMSYKDLNITF